MKNVATPPPTTSSSTIMITTTMAASVPGGMPPVTSTTEVWVVKNCALAMVSSAWWSYWRAFFNPKPATVIISTMAVSSVLPPLLMTIASPILSRLLMITFRIFSPFLAGAESVATTPATGGGFVKTLPLESVAGACVFTLPLA